MPTLSKRSNISLFFFLSSAKEHGRPESMGDVAPLLFVLLLLLIPSLPPPSWTSWTSRAFRTSWVSSWTAMSETIFSGFLASRLTGLEDRSTNFFLRKSAILCLSRAILLWDFLFFVQASFAGWLWAVSPFPASIQKENTLPTSTLILKLFPLFASRLVIPRQAV